MMKSCVAALWRNVQNWNDALLNFLDGLLLIKSSEESAQRKSPLLRVSFIS
jgi:hypothetical protein